MTIFYEKLVNTRYDNLHYNWPMISDTLLAAAWLWIPLTLCAAAAQTARNTAQRSLTQELGTLSATLARFLYGLPFAGLWLALLYWGPEKLPAAPSITAAYVGWIALGAFFQVAATATLLLAMRERNFAVAVTLSKTEVLQVALFSSILLYEFPTSLALLAMVLATAGVLLLSLPPRGQMLSLTAWASRSSLYGLACGACFALATVGFRGAALALEHDSPWVSGACGVFLAQTLQTVGLSVWIAWRSKRGLWPLLRAWRISLMAGSMGAIASLAWFTAYAMQSAGSVRTLGMIEVVFSYLVSRRFFSESFTRVEKIGIAVMLLSLLLICFSDL